MWECLMIMRFEQRLHHCSRYFWISKCPKLSHIFQVTSWGNISDRCQNCWKWSSFHNWLKKCYFDTIFIPTLFRLSCIYFNLESFEDVPSFTHYKDSNTCIEIFGFFLHLEGLQVHYASWQNCDTKMKGSIHKHSLSLICQAKKLGSEFQLNISCSFYQQQCNRFGEHPFY